MIERLQTIRPRLQELARLDPQLQLFGATTHHYELAPPLSEDEVHVFELLHNVRLPEEYRAFLLTVGSSGVGPYYGLKMLGDFEHAIDRLRDAEEEPDDWRLGAGLDPNFLSSLFPGGCEWIESPDTEGLDDDEANVRLEEWEETAWDDKWVAGTLCIAEYGCNILELLVVSGEERGIVWRDARCDGVNLHAVQRNLARTTPSSDWTHAPMFLEAEGGGTSFLDWYEWWLDWSIKEAKALAE